ncbi:MAG TPA: response regulator [Levilinea sp.]|nr:response regulator [Levilinea sp.]
MATAQKRVLVVDDALGNARRLRSALSVAGPDLVINVFPSAEEAILASARETVHLLVSEIRLPGISGADLARRMRAANPAVKVILISGLNQEQVDMHVNDLAVDGFFHKPFEVTQLIELAQRCLLEAVESVAQPGKTSPLKNLAIHTALGISLRELRSSANATAVWLYGPAGAYLAGVGDLPMNTQNTTWGKAAISCLHDAAAAALLPSGLHQRLLTLRGGMHDLILAGQGPIILALLLQKGSSDLRLALAFEETLRLLPVITAAAHDQAAAASLETGVAPQASQAEPGFEIAPLPPNVPAPVEKAGVISLVEPEVDPLSTPEDEAALSALASILDKGPDQAVATDIDAFWEAAADSGESSPPV